MRIVGLLLAGLGVVLGADIGCLNKTAEEVVTGVDLSGEIQVLTGGDTGIGFETALALAKANATLIILSHNALTTGHQAMRKIKEQAKNDKVSVLQIDLSSFLSVRRCAEQLMLKLSLHFGGKLPRIDSLLCDAGVYSPSSITKDGYERVVQTNFLGHLLLIDLLMPALRRGGGEAGKKEWGGRIIWVSSADAYWSCEEAARPNNCTGLGASELRHALTSKTTGHFRYPNAVKSDEPPLMPASNYALSKWLMVFHAKELARRERERVGGVDVDAGAGAAARIAKRGEVGKHGEHLVRGEGRPVLVFALRPSIVSTPMTQSIPASLQHYYCATSGGMPVNVTWPASVPCPLPAALGAATPTYLACTPGAELAVHSGSFFFACRRGPGSDALPSVREQMAQTKGEKATLLYQKDLYDAVMKWARGG